MTNHLHHGMHSGHTPKVLFLTPASFNKITGGGITFSNLFLNWPIDHIATIHNDPVPSTTDICNQYYVLTDSEISRWGILKHIPLGKASGSATGIGDSQNSAGLGLRVMRKLKQLIFGDGIPEQARLTPELESWIECYRPAVLYTILGSNAMMELADQIRERFGIPIVIHIMDDWIRVIYRGGVLSFVQRRKKNRLINKLMDQAVLRLAISDAMAEAYQSRYKHPFYVFQNAIDVERWKRFEKDPCRLSNPVRVGYIGSILPFAQLRSLLDCARAVQELNAEGFPITLEIYSPAHLAEQYRAALVQGDAITLHDTIADDLEFFKKMQEVDVLLLPVNFDDFTIEYIRYSMPTKVPAYLTVGTPILVYGPREVAQVSYAIKEGWGWVVSQQNLDALKTGLKHIATDMDLRKSLNVRARQVARLKHDASNVRTRFQTILAQATSN